MQTKRFPYIVSLVLFAALTIAACTKPDRSEEAMELSDELTDLGFENQELALTRVDSAELAGVFTAVQANTVKAMIYENADRLRMATYYAKKAIAAEAGHTITTPADSNLYCIARWILADGAFVNGEYGKSLALAKEILAFVGEGASAKDITMKCRALSQIAECESELNHIAESERLFLQCAEILMENTQHATDYADIDPLIYTLLSLNDLYIDNKMPEKALPLIAKMDTAINRLARCSNDTDWVLQKRRNNVTISKAMVYAANGQHNQAESLFQEHRQSQGLDATDKTAEGVYLTMTERYDEAIRLFDEANSMMRSSGTPVTDIYVKTLLKHKYDALQRAGRTAEALTLGDYMRQLTDSLRQQERQADVEQLQEIQQQEEEIARKHQSITTQRIVLIAAFLLLILSGYIIWRVRRDNRQLAEKNRSLYEQIQQREQAEAEERQQLQAQPEEKLTQNQLLYRRLCKLMEQPEVYTDADTNHETLARLLGTNHTYVYAALRECAGQTPADFINLYRIRHAALLLSTTDDPIGLIIEQSGITNRTTFSRIFREHYSMSPSEYRKAAK
ncbi:MAG: AraC family transcriptional regulator [Prevotella sp.]|nr:AraC family transcriptional regulator [Prevotella sp.]